MTTKEEDARMLMIMTTTRNEIISRLFVKSKATGKGIAKQPRIKPTSSHITDHFTPCHACFMYWTHNIPIQISGLWECDLFLWQTATASYLSHVQCRAAFDHPTLFCWLNHPGKLTSVIRQLLSEIHYLKQYFFTFLEVYKSRFKTQLFHLAYNSQR